MHQWPPVQKMVLQVALFSGPPGGPKTTRVKGEPALSWFTFCRGGFGPARRPRNRGQIPAQFLCHRLVCPGVWFRGDWRARRPVLAQVGHFGLLAGPAGPEASLEPKSAILASWPARRPRRPFLRQNRPFWPPGRPGAPGGHFWPKIGHFGLLAGPADPEATCKPRLAILASWPARRAKRPFLRQNRPVWPPGRPGAPGGPFPERPCSRCH